MHQDTMRELIESGSSALGSLAKEMLVHRNRVDAIETRKDKEIELARVKNETENDEPEFDLEGGDDLGVSGLPEAEIEAAIDELIEEETCSSCQQLLRGLKERGPRQQARGLVEYGEFKRSLSDGADAEELKETLRETVVLHSVFEEDIRSRPV